MHLVWAVALLATCCMCSEATVVDDCKRALLTMRHEYCNENKDNTITSTSLETDYELNLNPWPREYKEMKDYESLRMENDIINRCCSQPCSMDEMLTC